MFQPDILKGRDHLRDLYEDRSIILKRLLGKYFIKIGFDMTTVMNR